MSLRREKIASLPEGLTAPSISVNSNTLRGLPDRLSARRITVRGDHLEHLGRGIECDTLDLDATAITEIPDDLIARQRLVLSNCQRLTRLPEGLTTGTLIINGKGWKVKSVASQDAANDAAPHLLGCVQLP